MKSFVFAPRFSLAGDRAEYELSSTAPLTTKVASTNYFARVAASKRTNFEKWRTVVVLFCSEISSWKIDIQFPHIRMISEFLPVSTIPEFKSGGALIRKKIDLN